MTNRRSPSTRGENKRFAIPINAILSLAILAARVAYSLRQMRWLEHCLTGPGGEPPPWEIDYRAPVQAATPEVETT